MPDFTGQLTFIGHSTFLLVTPSGKRILLEGFVDSCPTTPEHFKGAGLGHLDAILVTHGHGDHLADAVAHQKRTGATIAGMVELMGWFGTEGVPHDKRIAFNKGGTIEIAGVHVTMVDAKHSSSTPDGSYAGEAAGFIIRLEDGYTIYHAGDTSVFGDMSLIGELYEPALALLPIGGHFTMDPTQAAKAVELLNVTDVVGMHWGTFSALKGTPAQLEELTQHLIVNVHPLEPGDSIIGIVDELAAST
jgi:L-ascorbate metabolism protein UlaG (beta-lactamase superfamily)